MPLQVLLDTPQKRIKYEALSSLVSGPDWDIPMSSGVYRDPITNTCFLYPSGFDPAYTLNNSGEFAKLGLSDFGLSMSWIAENRDAGGPFYRYTATGGNTSGVTGITTTTFGANQAMIAEWWNGSGTSSARGAFECGWNSAATGVNGVSLRFYQDGRAEVWKDDNKVGDYSIAGQPQQIYQGDATNTQAQTQNSSTLVLLIPCRGRELLVLSRGGGGFSHVFDDLPEDNSDSNVITSATPFWFEVPPNVEPMVRCAVLQYAPSGYLLGKKSYWRTELPDGQSPTCDVYGVGSGTGPGAASVVDGDNPSSAYSSNDNGLRLKVSLSGGTTTPFVYGARGFTQAVPTNTTGDSIDITEFVQSLTYEETDSISGNTARLVVNNPNAIDALIGGSTIRTQSYRSISIIDDGFSFNGVSRPPKTTVGHGIDDDTIDANTLVEIEIKDLFKLCEDYIFGDPIPLDGMTLYDAYNLLASMMCRDAQVSESLKSFTLPSNGAPTKNDFNLIVEVGDKGSEWLDRLHKTFCESYFHGTADDGTLLLLDPGDMPSVANVTLYATISAASGDYTSVFRTIDTQVIEAEANDIFVEGMDFRTRRPILCHQRDDDSANPELPPAARPGNWLGGPKKYSLGDPAFTDLATCQWVMEQIFPKLTAERELYELEAEFNPGMIGSTGLFRGSLINLNGYDVARIKTVSAQWVNTDDSRGGAVWRPTRYVAQAGYDITMMHTIGTRIEDMRHEHELRSLSKQSRYGGELGIYVAKKPIYNQMEAS